MAGTTSDQDENLSGATGGREISLLTWGLLRQGLTVDRGVLPRSA